MKPNLVCILPDIHYPHENKEALAIARRVIAKLKPTRTVLLGDMLDAGSFSTFAAKSIKEVRQANFLEEEIKPATKLLDFLDNHTREKVVFVEGNHEYRVERWAIEHGAGSQAIYEAISPQALLSKNRDKKRFKYIPYINTGETGFSYYDITPNLIAVHGWTAGVNAARAHRMKAQSKSVVFGHTHRMQSDAARDPFSKERRVAWSVGCLSNLQPIYLHQPGDWVLGMGLIYISRTNPRDWTEYTLKIQSGRTILPDGTEIYGD